MNQSKRKIPDLKAFDTDSFSTSSVGDLDKSIKAKLKEISFITSFPINNDNKEKVKELLIMCDVLINECHESQSFKTNRNPSIIKLIYEYARLSLNYETFKLQDRLDNMQEAVEEISTNQKGLKENSNNLAYTVLGFMASFSIVSAAVSAIEKINGLTDMVLFMFAIVLILLTTLIGLNNFYGSDDRIKTKLKNNYFLWKATCIIIILLVAYKGIIWFNSNKEFVVECFGRGVYSALKDDEEMKKYITDYIDDKLNSN